MKKCPYCAEEIQDEAIKCKHCSSMLAENKDEKWYFKTSTIVIGFLFVGPLVLPLVWLNPRFSPKVKIIISLVMIAVTYLIVIVFIDSLKSINSYYDLMFG